MKYAEFVIHRESQRALIDSVVFNRAKIFIDDQLRII